MSHKCTMDRTMFAIAGWCRNKSARRSSTRHVIIGIFCSRWLFVDYSYNSSWGTKNPEIQVVCTNDVDKTLKKTVTWHVLLKMIPSCKRKKG